MEAPPRRANKGKAPDTNSGAFFITLVFPWLGKKTVDKGAGVFQVLYPQFFFRGMDFAHTGAEDEGGEAVEGQHVGIAASAGGLDSGGKAQLLVDGAHLPYKGILGRYLEDRIVGYQFPVQDRSCGVTGFLEALFQVCCLSVQFFQAAAADFPPGAGPGPAPHCWGPHR